MKFRERICTIYVCLFLSEKFYAIVQRYEIYLFWQIKAENQFLIHYLYFFLFINFILMKC